MSNISLKGTIEPWNSPGLKHLSTGQFWGALTHADIIEL